MRYNTWGDFLFTGISFVFKRFWWWGTITGVRDFLFNGIALFLIGFGGGVQYPGEDFLFTGIAFVFKRFWWWYNTGGEFFVQRNCLCF